MHLCRHILGYIADMVAVMGEHLNGIRIVWIVWFGHQLAFKLAKVVFDIVAVNDTSDMKLNAIANTSTIWPHIEIIITIRNTEIL